MALTITFHHTVILIIGLLAAASTGSSLTESSATLTTLPPASPTGNSTDPCNFTDRYSLIDRVDADWRGYNLSLLVATCEGVCPLVYGAGNPDISGIGAMISYGIQGVTALIFGPILALLCIFYDIDLSTQSREPVERRARLLSLAGNLSRSAQTGNILTTLSVLTASIIRIQQLAPLSEISFIKTLSIYQFIISLAISLSYGAVFGTNSIRFAMLAFSAAAVYGMFMATLFMNGYPSSKVTLLDSITLYCVIDWDYPIPNLYVDEGDDKFNEIFWPSLVGGYIVVIIIMFLVMKYFGDWLGRVINTVRDGFVALCGRIHVDPKRLLLSLLITTMSLLLVSYSVLILWILQSQRQKLQVVSGDAYQDSQWGFGQFTAVLLWGPMCNDIILGIFEYVYPKPSATQPEMHEMQLLDTVSTSGLSGLPQPAHVRNLDPHLASNSGSRGGSNNDLRRLSQETLVGGEQGDSHLDSTLDRSSTSAGTGQGVVPTPPLTSSSVGASSSSRDSRPQLDLSTDAGDIGVHQRPTWPHNEAGTYLPINSPQ